MRLQVKDLNCWPANKTKFKNIIVAIIITIELTSTAAKAGVATIAGVKDAIALGISIFIVKALRTTPKAKFKNLNN